MPRSPSDFLAGKGTAAAALGLERAGPSYLRSLKYSGNARSRYPLRCPRSFRLPVEGHDHYHLFHLVVGPGVEGFADAVAQQVETENGEENGHTGKEGHPPGRREVRLCLEEHRPPARVSRFGTEPKKREGGLSDDRVAYRQGRLHQKRWQGVGE